ncbi:MAG: hypothetical protein GF388_08855 [Candidatus Aegiribacteria sp.]|nr:hypothetical protein [Candidatus Aegiribacteria sp.]MBD3295186.1 hypothetical protein [Candidatus Fermentibacteria bacterium]
MGRKYRNWRTAFGIPLLLAAVTLLILAAAGSVRTVPPMDDVYIHLVYGRSLFSASPLSFNTGVPSSGFTSPLWLVPSALASLAGTGAAPVVIMLLSLIAGCCALFLAGSPAALMILLTGPFLFHSSSGMETSMACLAVVAVWKWIVEGGKLSTASLIIALGFLTRPELVLMAIPVVISMEKKTVRSIATLMAPTVLAGLLWMSWNLHSIGMVLPSTFYAKQAVSWFQAASAGISGLVKGLLITSPLLPAALAAAVIHLLSRDKRNRKNTALASLPLILLAVSIYLQPNSYFQMRYYVPALTAAVLAVSMWLKSLRRRRLNTFILVLSMLPGATVFAIRRANAALDVESIDVEPALYIRENSSPEDTVAAADIGAVKWITGREILDLDGLVTLERLPGVGTRGWRWIYSRADYLLAFPDQYSQLVEEAEGTLVFLRGFGSEKSVICGEDSVALWRIR